MRTKIISCDFCCKDVDDEWDLAGQFRLQEKRENEFFFKTWQVLDICGDCLTVVIEKSKENQRNKEGKKS
jgi:hypothetical protein